MFLSLLALGGVELIKAKNQHAAEIARIDAMKDINEQEIAIKRFAEENNFKLKSKNIELELQKINLEHNRINKQIDNDREYKKDLTDNERKRIETYDSREREKNNKKYELKYKELSTNHYRAQMENDRLTEDMRGKHKINLKKEDNDYLIKIRKLEDERELNKLYENNRHDERIREIEAQKQVDLKKCDNERLEVEKITKKADMAHEKEMKLLKHNHEEKIKLMERESKNEKQKHELEKEKIKEEHIERTKQMDNNFNLDMETLRGSNQKELGEQEYRMEKLKLEFQLKFKQMDQQNILINNQINFQNQGLNPYEYSYPQQPQPLNYYNIHMYRNPPYVRQTPENNYNYQYQSPYGNPNQFRAPSQQYYYPPPQMNQNQINPQFPPQYNNNYMPTKPMEEFEENYEKR